MKEKTYVQDIERNIYDFKDEEKDAYRINAGLTPEIVEKLSKERMIQHGCRISVLNLYRYITI